MEGNGVGKKDKKILLFAVFGLILIGSCTKTNEFTIGKDFVESQTKLMVIDTFRVDLSTVLIDSIATSSTKIAYVGDYEDNIFGSIKCESYFELAFEPFAEIEDRAIFDSAAFILDYTDNNFGDTTSLMSVSIHKLIEKIEPFVVGNKNYLFNNSSFEYEFRAIGTLSFYPEPHSSDTAICIPINSLGEELFNLIRDKDEKVSSQEWFNDYLKGFVLASGTPDNKAIMGFSASAERLILRIYYHLDREVPEEKEITIKMGEESHQFNNVNIDLTNTSLNKIKMEANEIAYSETDSQVFLQGMVGLLPKIRFPSLQDVLANERWKILKAELIIEPVKFSYDLFSLPDSLFLYETDRENRLNALVTDISGRSTMAFFEFDKIFGEDTRYTYDITSFINSELSDAYVDYERGLIISLVQDKLTSSFERLLIEGKDPPVKLRLYCLSY